MAAAEELLRRLPLAERESIILVDRHNFSVFTPMLTEVIGGELDPRHVGTSLRRLAPPLTFLQGEVRRSISARVVSRCASNPSTAGSRPASEN